MFGGRREQSGSMAQETAAQPPRAPELPPRYAAAQKERRQTLGHREALERRGRLLAEDDTRERRERHLQRGPSGLRPARTRAATHLRRVAHQPLGNGVDRVEDDQLSDTCSAPSAPAASYMRAAHSPDIPEPRTRAVPDSAPLTLSEGDMTFGRRAGGR